MSDQNKFIPTHISVTPQGYSLGGYTDKKPEVKPKLPPFDPYYAHLLSALANSHEYHALEAAKVKSNEEYKFFMGMSRAFTIALGHYQALQHGGEAPNPAAIDEDES